MKRFFTVCGIVACLMLFESCDKRIQETRPIRKDVSEVVFASGILEAKNTYHLTAQVEGFISQIYFKEGDYVEQGKVMAVIDNQENVVNNMSAQEQYIIAKKNALPDAPLLKQAKNTVYITEQKMLQDSVQLSRYQALIVKKSIAQIEYENSIIAFNTSKANYKTALENFNYLIQQANQQLITNRTQNEISTVHFSNNYIKSVVSGKVYSKLKQRGDYVRRGDIVATIGSADTLYARVNFDEGNIGKIRINQKAVVKLNPIQSKNYNAVVSQIYPSFDEANQSYIGILDFTDSLDFSYVGTQLQANIMIGTIKNALVIPREYLRFDGTVIVKGEKDPVKVTTGFMGSTWVEIVSGLDEGITIIADKSSGGMGEIPEF